MKRAMLIFSFFVSAQALADHPQIIFSCSSDVPPPLQAVIQSAFEKACPWDLEATTPIEFGSVVQEVSIDQGQVERHYLVGFQYGSAAGTQGSFSISAVEYPVLNVSSESERFAVTELPDFCF